MSRLLETGNVAGAPRGARAREGTLRAVPRSGDLSSTAPAHVHVLDGLRGLLTVLVLFHHIVAAILYSLPDDHLEPWARYVIFAHGSSVALPMYFVISGFVIFLPAARSDGRLGDLRWYALRRVARIAPAYYLNLAAILFAWPFCFPEKISPMATRHGAEVVLGHLFFLQRLLYEDSDIGFGLNGSVWTLTLEEFFYATIPLASLLVFRKPFRVLLVTCLVTVAWRLACLHLNDVTRLVGLPTADAFLGKHLMHQFPGYAFQFVCGSVAALLYTRWWRHREASRWRRIALGAHVAGLVAIALDMYHVGSTARIARGMVTDVTHDIVPAVVFAVLIVAVAVGPEWPKRLYTNAICRFLGDISYGVYLWHMVLIQLAYRYSNVLSAKLTFGEKALVYTAWVLPGSLLLGWLSFRVVEKPLSAWVRARWREASFRVAAEPTA